MIDGARAAETALRDLAQNRARSTDPAHGGDKPPEELRASDQLHRPRRGVPSRAATSERIPGREDVSKGIRRKVTTFPSALPVLLDELLISQGRLVDECARLPPLDRLSACRRTRLLQLAAVISLLALGLLVSHTILWALIAIPMVVIVLLFLMELEGTRVQAAAARVVEAMPMDNPHQPDRSTGVVVRRRKQRQRSFVFRRGARATR